MLMALLGYVLARLGRPLQGESLRFLVAQVGSPALILTAMMKVSPSEGVLLDYGLATVCALLAFALIGTVVLKLRRWSVRTFLPSLMFGNTGNLGLPLALYAAGPTGLAYAAVSHTLIAVANFVFGPSIAHGRTDWKFIVTNPTLIAAVLGIAAATMHVVLPPWLRNTLELCANLTIPLMLVMLGASLATIKVSSLDRTLVLAALRIAMGLAVGLTLAWAFNLSGTARAVFVLQLSMPVAVYNYLFAMLHNTDPEGVASLVVASTLMAVVVIPVLLVVLL